MASFANFLLRSFSLAGRRRLNCCNVSTLSTPLPRTSRGEFVSPWLPKSPVWLSKRHYAASNGKESDGEGETTTGEEEEGGQSDSDGEGKDPGPQEGGEGELGGLEMLPVARHHAIAPVNIPDNFPEVPILPISRNPLFPRFVKMLEVSLR